MLYDVCFVIKDVKTDLSFPLVWATREVFKCQYPSNRTSDFRMDSGNLVGDVFEANATLVTVPVTEPVNLDPAKGLLPDPPLAQPVAQEPPLPLHRFTLSYVTDRSDDQLRWADDQIMEDFRQLVREPSPLLVEGCFEREQVVFRFEWRETSLEKAILCAACIIHAHRPGITLYLDHPPVTPPCPGCPRGWNPTVLTASPPFGPRMRWLIR